MLVTRVWPTQRPGGMPFVCFDRAVELAKAHEVHVVTTSDSSTAGQVRKPVVRREHGIVVHYTGSPAHQWPDDTHEFASWCIDAAEEIRPDLIHSESLDRAQPWWDGLKDRPPVVVTMHGFGFGGWLSKWNEHRALGGDPEPFPHEKIMEERKALETVDVVLAVSRWEERLLRDQYGLKNVRLVYNPIPPYFFHPRPRKSVRPSFLCAAISQGTRRGFGIASEAAKLAKVRLRRCGAVPRERMMEVYDKVNAVVLPTSFCQGYDLTIAEARARGVPAIMTPTGSYLDEAEPWDRLVPLGDVRALAAVLEGFDFADVHVPTNAADQHRPEEHVRCWLEAVR